MFHDWVAPTANLHPYRIFGTWVPHPDQVRPWLEFGLPVLWLVYVFALAGQRKWAPRLGWFAVAATYAIAHMFCARMVDDLFVNLEHPYNLLHHGRFSVDHDRMVDGTTELPFYLLLTPFAVTQRVLFTANYVLGMLLGAAHLWRMKRLLPAVRPEAQAAALGAAALSFPFVQNFGCGYGNLAVSLLALLGLEAVIQRRERVVVAACLAMPLLRLDGALFSAALGLTWWWVTKRFPWRQGLAAAAAVLCSLGVYKLLYGHPIPNPIRLRSVSLSEIPLIGPGMLGRRLMQWWMEPARLATFAVILGVGASRWTARRDEVGRALAPWALFNAPIALYYLVVTLRGWNPLYGRYFMPLEVAITLLAARDLASLFEALLAGSVKALRPAAARASVGLFVVALAVIASRRVALALRAPMAVDVLGINGKRDELDRIGYHAWAGREFDRVTPPGWTFAVTEMDTFGHMNDRRIVDLWGFSNPDLVTYGTKNVFGTRYSMSVFLASGVELSWIRTHYNLSFVRAPAARIERAIFADNILMGQGHPAFGDVREVVQRYDLVRVRHGPDCASLLWVKRERYAELEAAWRRHGWRPVLDREIDRAELTRLWETDVTDGPFGANAPVPPRGAAAYLRGVADGARTYCTAYVSGVRMFFARAFGLE
ncbi:MAG: hypothetical protein U0324_40475 [Polyangiales bacterium]